MADEASIDWTTLKELEEFCGGEALQALIATFLEHAPKQVEDMETACQSGDCRLASNRAHTFRSGAGSLGLLGLCPLAASIEAKADKGEGDSVKALVLLLRAEFDAIIPKLEAIQQDPSILARQDE